MHLLLVDNLVLPDRDDLDALDVHPHLGLISLAAVARDGGHQVTIFDPKRHVRSGFLAYDQTLYRNAARILLAENPDAVGFTTLGCSFIFALKTAQYLRRARPELPILLGGPHATILHREIMERYPQFDVILRHEAEETLPGVLASLEARDFGGIPGVTWRSPADRSQICSTPGLPMVRDLDSLPMPVYELYPVEELQLSMMRVEAGRGCPFMCTFCSTASFFQRSYRLKSPQRILREMDSLHQRYGVSEFKLSHDLFTVDRKKVLAFCDAVRGRNYRWRVSARVDCVDPELLEAMASAGCDGLYFGIETGSARMQKISKKHLDLDLVEPTVRQAERLGIRSTASFITGYPEELEEDLDATLDMIGRCARPPEAASLTQLHLLMPEPGTELFHQNRERLAYDGFPGPFNARLLESDDEDYVRGDPTVFATYHYYQPAIARGLHTFAFEAVQLLTSLDPEALDYLLRHYERSLALLVSRFRAWLWSTRPARRADAGSFQDFIAASHGPDHHLVSLVRYAFGTQKARGAGDSQAQLHSGGPADPGRYRLDAHAVLFDDLHDCGALLSRARSAPGQIADAEAGERGCYLVVGSGGSLFNYAISPALFALLKECERPRSYQDLAKTYRELSGGDSFTPALLRRLVEFGALAGGSAETHSDSSRLAQRAAG